MLPTDLRPEELDLKSFSDVWVTVHTEESTILVDSQVLYTTRVGDLDSNDLELLLDSLEFILNKYNEACEYIKSKQNNL